LQTGISENKRFAIKAGKEVQVSFEKPGHAGCTAIEEQRKKELCKEQKQEMRMSIFEL